MHLLLFVTGFGTRSYVTDNIIVDGNHASHSIYDAYQTCYGVNLIKDGSGTRKWVAYSDYKSNGCDTNHAKRYDCYYR